MRHIRPLTGCRVQPARVAPEVFLTVLVQVMDAMLTYLAAIQGLEPKEWR